MTDRAVRPQGRRLNAEELSTLRREWQAGTPTTAIAQQLGITSGSVAAAARRLGLPARSLADRKRPRRLTPEDRENLARMWCDGLPAADIADALGIHPGSVYHHAKKMDLGLRNVGGPAGLGEQGDHLLVELWLSGTPLPEIAQRLSGIHEMTVRYHVARLKLPPRRRTPRKH